MKDVEPAPDSRSEFVYKLIIFMVLSGIVFIALYSGSFLRLQQLYATHAVLRHLSAPLSIYTCIMISHLIYRAILCSRYRPYPRAEGRLPRVTVIIPAYNEGEMMAEAISSVVRADYPWQLLEVICIDDGSEDDTWQHINSLQVKHPSLITAHRFKTNRGKREGLAYGFRNGTGEIMLTMDSDTIMDKDAIRCLVSPFRNSRVGATTAKVRVFNEKENLITRILGVRYTMAFEFYRASRSVLRTVFCCSGVLSAYRKSAIDSILEPWLNQRFLGQRSTYGDDRSLTNFILRSGHETIYQNNAVAYTTVPNNLMKLAKMLTRWHKSFCRESIVFASFMLTNYRKSNRILPILDFIVSILLMFFQFYIVGFSLIYIFIDPFLIFRFLALISLIGLIYMLFYIKFEKNTDFVYGLLYSFLHIFFLIWTIPYAVLTLKNNSWLTR